MVGKVRSNYLMWLIKEPSFDSGSNPVLTTLGFGRVPESVDWTKNNLPRWYRSIVSQVAELVDASK